MSAAENRKPPIDIDAVAKRNADLIRLVAADYRQAVKGAEKYLSHDVRRAILWGCVGSVITAQAMSEHQGRAGDFFVIYTKAAEKVGLWSEG